MVAAESAICPGLPGYLPRDSRGWPESSGEFGWGEGEGERGCGVEGFVGLDDCLAGVAGGGEVEGCQFLVGGV